MYMYIEDKNTEINYTIPSYTLLKLEIYNY